MAQGLRVDVAAVHHFSETDDVKEFRAFLEVAQRQGGRPARVTEWALADWGDPSRVSVAEQAAFAQAATEMTDDLAFVEQHAWFAAHEGGDGWFLKSGVFDGAGGLTAVGRMFAELNAPTPTFLGTSAAETISGTARSDRIEGRGGGDVLAGLADFDTIRAEGDGDILRGGGRQRPRGRRGRGPP